MDSKNRRRQARLQGLHNVRLPNTRFDTADQPKYQSGADNEFINNSSGINLESQMCDASKNGEFQVQMKSKPEEGERDNEGRKSTRRYPDCSQGDDFHSSKRGYRRNYNHDRRPRNISKRDIDETVKRLNGLKVNNDAVSGGQMSGEAPKEVEKDSRTRSYRSRTVRRSSDKNINRNDKEQRHSPKSRPVYARDGNYRGMRNGPSFGRNSDENTSKANSDMRSFNSGLRAQSGHNAAFSNYEPNEQLMTNSFNNKTMNGTPKKPGIRSSSNFVYEETNKGENIIQKTKSLDTLNIIGWHKLVQCSAEDKESYLYFKPDFLGEEKENYLQDLKQSIKWQEKEIIIRGEKYLQPRLVAWYGPLPYSYSNSVLEPNCEFPHIIMGIKKRIEDILKGEKRNVVFNSVLLNLYRDGKDSVAWHSDDELSMGVHPTIASVSLGETRRFEIKLKQDRRENGASPQVSEGYVIHLTSGSLLVMDGAMQEYWLHRVPKEFHDRKCRINLTFRTVYALKEKEQS